MTREEAIKIIEVVFKSKEAYKHNDSVTHQALNMAIEALSADAEQTELPQYEEWQDSFNKMCESAKPTTFVADEWYIENFGENNGK